MSATLTQKIQKKTVTQKTNRRRKIESRLSLEVPGSESTDKETKAALKDDLLGTEKYPTTRSVFWIKTEEKKTKKNNMKKWEKRDRME
jgi:hypothetical protein